MRQKWRRRGVEAGEHEHGGAAECSQLWHRGPEAEGFEEEGVGRELARHSGAGEEVDAGLSCNLG